MTTHGICFDFHYRPKPSQIGKNGSAAAADAHLAGPLFCQGLKQQINIGFQLLLRIKANLAQHLKEKHVLNSIVNLTMGWVFSRLIALETA